MKMTAPAGFADINVGGETFTVVDGHITVPDHYSLEGIAALRREGFAPVPATETPAEAAFIAALDHEAAAEIERETPAAEPIAE